MSYDSPAIGTVAAIGAGIVAGAVINASSINNNKTLGASGAQVAIIANRFESSFRAAPSSPSLEVGAVGAAAVSGTDIHQLFDRGPISEWDEAAKMLFRKLLYARADNRTTPKEDALFEQLQTARRVHDAKKNGVDLVKEWLYLQQEREITAFLKRYGSPEASTKV